MKKISLKRIIGVVIRHLYNFRHNYDRLTDTFYWPLLDILSFGFLAIAIDKMGGVPDTYRAALLSCVMLWFVLWRGQNEISVGFLEELWSDNVGNIFGSPLSLFEYILGIVLLDAIKIGLMFAFTGTIAFWVYDVNILNLGFVLIPLVILLFTFGVTFGLFFVALFLRFGSTVQTLAWAGGTLIVPFSGVYYPISVFPDSWQWFIHLIPSSYIFETVRAVITTGVVPWNNLFIAAGIISVYLFMAVVFLYTSFQKAQHNGLSRLK